MVTATSKVDSSAAQLEPSNLETLPGNDPVLDIPKTPFNETRYQHALDLPGTISRTREYAECISLEQLHAPNNMPGSGFGTAIFRKMIGRSIALGCPGQISTHVSTAYGSPHLFYLYMGMEPDTRSLYYAKPTYGDIGLSTLHFIAQSRELSDADLKNALEAVDKQALDHHLQEIRFILNEGLKIRYRRKLTVDDVIDQRVYLVSLLDRKLDYRRDVFLPEILKALESKPLDRHPDTSILGSIKMHMSEKGYARWKYVIDNNLEFVPFRDFAHLDLTAKQKERVNEILIARAAPNPEPRSSIQQLEATLTQVEDIVVEGTQQPTVTPSTGEAPQTILPQSTEETLLTILSQSAEEIPLTTLSQSSKETITSPLPCSPPTENNNPEGQPSEEVDRTPSNFATTQAPTPVINNFYLKTLINLSLFSGASLITVGLLSLSPQLFIMGPALFAVGFFSHKKLTQENVEQHSPRRDRYFRSRVSCS